MIVQKHSQHISGHLSMNCLSVKALLRALFKENIHDGTCFVSLIHFEIVPGCFHSQQ